MMLHWQVHTLYYEDYAKVTDSILGGVLRALAPCVNAEVSTRILGRRTALFLIPDRVPHGSTPRSQY